MPLSVPSISNNFHHTAAIIKSKNYDYQTSSNQSKSIGKTPKTDYNTIFSEGPRIRVDGVPTSGAKSRVETQIKLSIELISRDGNKVPYWSYLRIPEFLLARSKLRKSQQQKYLDGSAAAMVSDESKVLDLEAQVICESDEKKKIKMCQGCVRRERKRAERKKNSKPSFHTMKPSVIDEAFERDRQRILLFNCESLVNFSTGDAIFPTRITCYCRHHNERIGFRVRFALKNDKGLIIASGESPPIMITDDHKTSKQYVPSAKVNGAKKRRRATSSDAEDNIDTLITPVSSRRSSFKGSETGTSATSLFTDTASLAPGYFSYPSSSTLVASVLKHFSQSPLLTPGKEMNYDEYISPPQTPTTDGIWDNVMSNYSYGHFELPVTATSNTNHCLSKTQTMTPLLSQPVMLQHKFDEYNSLPLPRRRAINDMSDTCAPCLINGKFIQLESQQVFVCHQQHASITHVSSTLINEPNVPLIPILDTISPSQGSYYGGVQVTITGQGFHRDLTLMFGNRPATPVYWSPNSIVCILPPAEQNGQVLVSFKEHSLMRASEIPPLFNYFEESRQDILALSFHVVGINNQQQCHNSTFKAARNFNHAKAYYEDQQLQATEFQVIDIISKHCSDGSSALGRTTLGGQNLLHLAGYLNYDSLIIFLLKRDPNLVHSQDRNGLSPLHFSCQNKSTEAIYALMRGGANIAHISTIGTPMELVASLLSPAEFRELERRIYSQTVDQDSSVAVSWLPSLFVLTATQNYHHCSNHFSGGLFNDVSSSKFSNKNNHNFPH